MELFFDWMSNFSTDRPSVQLETEVQDERKSNKENELLLMKIKKHFLLKLIFAITNIDRVIMAIQIMNQSLK